MKFKLLILFVVALVVFPINLQAAKRPITFDPKKIDQTIGLGDQVTIPISFSSSKNLGYCELWIVPELQPFTSLSQTQFNVVKGQDYTLDLTIEVPNGSQTGMYNGTIHLRGGTKTIPATFKVELNVVDGAAVIDEQGGRVKVTDENSDIFGAELGIPAGALSEEYNFTIEKVDLSHELPEESKNAGPVIRLKPETFNFTKKIFVTIPYNDEDNDGIIDGTDLSERSLQPLTFQESVGRWLYVEKYGQDRNNNTITFLTNHFSDFTTGTYDWSIYGTSVASFFTVDGWNGWENVLFPGEPSDGFSRPAYLKKALIYQMALGLTAADVYSFGCDPNDPDCESNSSWSGETNWTEYYIHGGWIIDPLTHYIAHIQPSLIDMLRSEYFKAKNVGKKFILISHSWGNVLNWLGLTYCPDVIPDLVITLSNPIGTANIEWNLDEWFLAGFTVRFYRDLVTSYVVKKVLDTRRFDTEKDYDNDLKFKRWINYYAVGDLISGPMSEDLYHDIEDVRFDSPEMTDFPQWMTTRDTMYTYHAISSLEEDKWIKHLTTWETTNLAKPFRDQIRSLLLGYMRVDCAEIRAKVARYSRRWYVFNFVGSPYEENNRMYNQVYWPRCDRIYGAQVKIPGSNNWFDLYCNEIEYVYEYHMDLDVEEEPPIGVYQFNVKLDNLQSCDLIRERYESGILYPPILRSGSIQNGQVVDINILSPLIDWYPVPGASYYKVKVWDETWSTKLYDSSYDVGKIYETFFVIPADILSENSTYNIEVFAYDLYSKHNSLTKFFLNTY